MLPDSWEKKKGETEEKRGIAKQEMYVEELLGN